MNKRFIIAFSGVFLLLSVYCIGFIAKADGENWLTGWDYRKSHTINSSSGAETNYQIKIIVNYTTGSDSGNTVYVNSKCRTDFGDIRFTDNDGETELNYWLEEKTNSDYAIFWIKVADDLDNNQVIYFYYGNDSATYTDNYTDLEHGENTFLLFDNFNDASLDTAKWREWLSGGSYSESGGVLTVTGGGASSWEGIGSKTKFSYNHAFEWRGKLTDNDYGSGIGLDERTADGTYSGNFEAANFKYAAFEKLYFSQNGANIVEESRSDTIDSYSRLSLLWISGEIKFLINDVLKTTHDGNSVPDGSDTLGLSADARSSGQSSYVDYCFVRKYVYPEPSHGSWGSEEEEFVDSFPYYSDISDNEVTQVGESLQCYITIEDDLNINGYIFCHNSSGVYTNYTFSVESVTIYIEVTNSLTLNFTKNVKVGYKWFMYDNSSQYNQTSIFYVTTTPLHVSFYLNNSTMGEFYVDLINTVNETQNSYNYNQSINLIGVPFNSNYTFNNFTWIDFNYTTNDYDYYTDSNNTLWCNFGSVSIGDYTEEDLNSYFVIGSVIVGVIAFSIITIIKEKK